MDTYRVGTMLEMVRELAYSLADVGLNTRILIQPSMGEGIFKSLPLSLSGVMSIMKAMDWQEGLVGSRVRFGNVRIKEKKKTWRVFVEKKKIEAVENVESCGRAYIYVRPIRKCDGQSLKKKKEGEFLCKNNQGRQKCEIVRTDEHMHVGFGYM